MGGVQCLFNPPYRLFCSFFLGSTLTGGVECTVVHGVVRLGKIPARAGALSACTGQWASAREEAGRVRSASFQPDTCQMGRQIFLQIYNHGRHKVEDSSKWPMTSLCCGSLHPEFRALLICLEWLALVRNHRAAAPSVAGTQYPPPSSVLMLFENLREMYSGLPSPSVPAWLGKDLISVKRQFFCSLGLEQLGQAGMKAPLSSGL